MRQNKIASARERRRYVRGDKLPWRFPRRFDVIHIPQIGNSEDHKVTIVGEFSRRSAHWRSHSFALGCGFEELLTFYLRRLGAQGNSQLLGANIELPVMAPSGSSIEYRLEIDGVVKHNGVAYFAHGKGEILFDGRVACSVSKLRLSVGGE